VSTSEQEEGKKSGENNNFSFILTTDGRRVTVTARQVSKFPRFRRKSLISVDQTQNANKDDGNKVKTLVRMFDEESHRSSICVFEGYVKSRQELLELVRTGEIMLPSVKKKVKKDVNNNNDSVCSSDDSCESRSSHNEQKQKWVRFLFLFMFQKWFTMIDCYHASNISFRFL